MNQTMYLSIFILHAAADPLSFFSLSFQYPSLPIFFSPLLTLSRPPAPYFLSLSLPLPPRRCEGVSLCPPTASRHNLHNSLTVTLNNNNNNNLFMEWFSGSGDGSTSSGGIKNSSGSRNFLNTLIGAVGE